MTEIVKNASAKSGALFEFLGDILKRAETSACLLDFTELELHKTAAAIQALQLVRIKSRHYHLRWYKSCFVGKDFVDALCNPDLPVHTKRETATLLGNYLLRGGLLHHVCDDHVFKDDYLFYRFYTDDIRDALKLSGRRSSNVTFYHRSDSDSTERTSTTSDSSREGSVDESFHQPDLADLVALARKHLDIRDRKYHLKIYHNVFTGIELVDVFINNGITDKRSHATLLGRALWTAGYIHHVHDDHQFSDRGFFYRFYQDEDYFTFMDTISWARERKPGFPKKQWKPMNEDDNIAWRISPHTALTSIIFDASILEDNFVCDNYIEKYRDEVRSKVLKLLHTSASQGKQADEAHRFAHHWERIYKDGHSHSYKDVPKESSSSNSPIYRLVGEKKEKPSVLKRIDFLTTADASNFILSFLGDGSIGNKQNWLIEHEKKLSKIKGSNDLIDTSVLETLDTTNDHVDLKCVDQSGQQAIIIRKERHFNALLPTSHTCAVQDLFRIEDPTMAKTYGFPIGTCIVYEFGVEHRDVNSRHLDKKSNAIKPKICSVTHYVHDKYDDLFRQLQHASKNSPKVAASLANSLTNLLRPKDEPNIEREVLVSAWAVEPPVETGAGAKCRTTLLSQTIFGGKKLPFWIECEVMKHHPLFDGLMKDKAKAESIYVRSSTVAEASVSQEISLSDFEIMAVLGRGGYGKVLQVKLNGDKNNTGTDDVYAMKAIKREAVSDGESKKRLILERLILTEANHPFITSLEYAFHTSTKLYMVMEFVAGGDLFTHIHCVRGFTEERILDHASEMALGIEALHSNRVIYRDLKPENVLLDHKGHIKLVDFGLSYRGEKGEDIRTDSFCGTEKYMAPEQLLNRVYGPEIDWWSFGIVLAEMLSGGKHPFRGRNRLETCRNMVKKKQAYVRRLKGAPPVSKELISLMNGFLEKQCTDRLGYGENGFLRIKKMPFFAEKDGSPLNWKNVEQCNRKLTFTPDVSGATDLKYFDDIFTDEKPVDSVVPGSREDKGGHWFSNAWPFGKKKRANNTPEVKSAFEDAFDYSPKQMKNRSD